MAGIGRRLYEVLRANLNALLDRAAGSEPRPPPPPPEATGPGWDREIAQHYANLELPYGADLPAVKRQYRKLMSRYHPDRHHRDAKKAEIANRLAAELTRSYEALVKYLGG